MPIQDTLTDKLGPLPVWAWGAIAGATIAVGRYVYDRTKGATTAAAVDVSGPSAAAAPASTAETSSLELGSFMAAGTYTPPADTSFVTSPASTTSPLYPQSNDEWVSMATPLVVERSSNTNVATLAALTKYVNGEALTEREAEIVELAIKAVGVPPYSVAPVTVKANVTAPDTTPPPAAVAPAPAPAAVWAPPAYLAGAQFVIDDQGGAVYQIVPGGIQWVPSEDAFFRLGGGGTVNLRSGPYRFRDGGTAPVPIPGTVLATFPKVGALPPG